MWRIVIAVQRVAHTSLSMVSRESQIVRRVANYRFQRLYNYLLKCSIDWSLTNEEFRRADAIVQACFVYIWSDLLATLVVGLFVEYAVYDELLFVISSTRISTSPAACPSLSVSGRQSASDAWCFTSGRWTPLICIRTVEVSIVLFSRCIGKFDREPEWSIHKVNRLHSN